MSGLSESQSRLDALKKLLKQKRASTQDELREELERLKFNVTQSTISRDLRRIGAMKTIDASGRTVYRTSAESAPISTAKGLQDHIVGIKHNGFTIVIHTTPGSASLIARHIDFSLPEEILGTIAGDDTVFVAPAQVARISETVEQIETVLGESLI